MQQDPSHYRWNIDSQSKTSLGAHGRYEVVHTRIAVRSSPSTQANAVGVLNRGVVVQGWPYSVNGNPWLLLDAPSCEVCTSVSPFNDAHVWALMHGKSVGLDELLSVTKKRFEFPKSFLSCHDRTRWYTSYRVMEPEVWIMPKPDPMQKLADRLGTKVYGEIVRGDEMIINDAQWLKLEFSGASAWVLIDGAPVGVQRQFLQMFKEEPVPWEVVEKEVWIMPKADPKQSLKDSIGVKSSNEIVKGTAVTVAGIEWLQVEHGGKQAWILIEGRAVQANRKFLRRWQPTSKQAMTHAATWVSERGGRLSTQWLLAQGGLSFVPWSITEGALDAGLDVGLASSISLLHIELAEGCQSEKYIVKRSGAGGSSVFHTDQRLLERECRFYLDVCPAECARMKQRQKLNKDLDRKLEEEEAEAKQRLRERREDMLFYHLCELRAQEQRHRVEKGAPFDGRYRDDDDLILTIENCSIHGLDGAVLRCSIKDHSTCTLSFGEEHFEGQLREDGCLLWNDGAKWIRQRSEAEEKLLQTHAEASQQADVIEKDEACLAAASRMDAKTQKETWSRQVGPPHLLLGGSLRVPRCLGAEWEDGCDSSFVLVLEMLQEPFWKSAGASHESAGFGSDMGCSREQAFSAMKALGDFHGMFHGMPELENYDWLPVTPLHIENAMFFQSHYQAVVGTLEFMLSKALSARAYRTCKKLQDHYAEMVKRLAQPPLTFVHGDFHPGNVRFSATTPPATAAFDWQFCCRCRGAYDFAYFISLFAPPEIRRKYENDLGKCYLEACGRQSEAADFIDEVRAALLVVFAFFVMVNMSAFQVDRTRNLLARYVGWIGSALDDWGCDCLME